MCVFFVRFLCAFTSNKFHYSFFKPKESNTRSCNLHIVLYIGSSICTTWFRVFVFVSVYNVGHCKTRCVLYAFTLCMYAFNINSKRKKNYTCETYVLKLCASRFGHFFSWRYTSLAKTAIVKGKFISFTSRFVEKASCSEESKMALHHEINSQLFFFRRFKTRLSTQPKQCNVFLPLVIFHTNRLCLTHIWIERMHLHRCKLEKCLTYGW